MKRTLSWFWLAVVCAALTLAGYPQVAEKPVAGEAKPSPPKLRLGDAVRPTHYALELTILPTEDSFRGSIDIDVHLGAATSLLWLNATELSIEQATLSLPHLTLPTRVIAGNDDFAGFALERAVGPGNARLHIEYKGALNKTETAGFFKQKEGEDWYVFSQFEATDARRAFPCFDEPSFKVPWQLTLRIPQHDIAVSNTPVLSESNTLQGMKIVRFAQTRPLPSYLVALGVGPFNIVEAGKAGRKRTPIRIIVPRGKSAEARYAVESTPKLFSLLEEYFGIPYPYEKLDHLSVPQTVTFGAMENAGLITYAQSIILASPEEETVQFKRGYAITAAHEMAHHWVGDLVTMAWWNDVWLNESFATWMEDKIVIQWKPEWEHEISRVHSQSDAMAGDALVTARKIRQPIESKDDIVNAFDNVSYGKGAAVLSMFEAWMGPKKFQAGVRRYLSARAHGNATAENFLRALQAQGSPGVAQAFSTFLDQVGIPLVSVELRCGKGVLPRLVLSQKRFLPMGSTGSADQLWQIPVCIRYQARGKEGRLCTMLTKETAELPLPSKTQCPDWVLANDGQAGYYRTFYRGDLLGRLLKDRGRELKLPERVGLLWDVKSLAQAGLVPVGEALALVPVFSNDPSRHIVSVAGSIAAGVKEHLVPQALEPNYARFIRAMFGERARSLGFKARAGEDDDTRLLRQSLVNLVANAGEDPVLRTEAAKRARQWLIERQSVDADMVATVLTVAARDGDRQLFEQFHAEANKAKERRDRERLLWALGSFRDPALESEALRIFLSDEFDSREAMSILSAGQWERSNRQMVFDFLKQNFDAVVARLPREIVASLPSLAEGFCDEAHGSEVEAFFKDRTTKFAGGPRNLQQVLESISLCTTLKATQQPGVAAFLEKY